MADIVSSLVKFNGQANGRDKLCRFFQYAAKFALWQLQSKEANQTIQLAEKLKNLENALSATRKVLRLGKSIDSVQGAYKAAMLTDAVFRVTLSLSKLSNACFLLMDHVIWAKKTGLITNVDTKRWSRYSSRCWLLALLMNLLRDLYGISLAVRAQQRERARRRKDGDSPPRTGVLSHLLTCHQPLVIDTVKNAADLVLPMSNLRMLSASDGLQGALGMLASFLAIVVVWNPKYKLTPS